jgi:hypothetical protein
MGHNASHGCTKCAQIGRKINNVVTFSTKLGTPMSDNDFTNRTYPLHHKVRYRNTKSELENSGIKMISQFAIDPMHLLDLGVCRKILNNLLEGKTKNFKLNSESKVLLSNRLISLAPFLPMEFARKPRSLAEIKLWKAVEYRQFILYLGITFLDEFIPHEYFCHYIQFFSAYRLLLYRKSYSSNLENIQSLIEDFVEIFPELYGENSVTYNVHTMLHLTQCVQELGYLQDISAYKFENFMQTIKKSIRKNSQILPQLDRRFNSLNMLEQEPQLGFIYNKRQQIVSYKTANFTLTLKDADNVCCIYPCIPIRVTKFEKINNEKFVIGRRFLNVRDFFSRPVFPLDSLTGLGVVLTNQTPFDVEERFAVQEITYKFVCIPKGNSYVMLPLVHNIC